MSSVIGRGADVARQILDKRDPYGTELRDNTFCSTMLVEAYAIGLQEGIARSQAAVAQVHARVQLELLGDGGAR